MTETEISILQTALLSEIAKPQEKVWCEHIIRPEDLGRPTSWWDKQWELHNPEGFAKMLVRETWQFCPICGQSRPE